MGHPLVSIIVPSFNQGRYIGETLESIFSQDYRPIEVIVSDGGSTDETVTILESFGEHPDLLWWSAPDDGVCDAVNKALARARGEVLAIQSSDDLYLPGAISAAVSFLQGRPDLSLAFGDVEYIDEESRVTGRTSLPEFRLREYLARRLYIPQASTFFRADAARVAGGWRQEVSYAADADYWLALIRHGRASKIPAVLARYRCHPGQRERQWRRIILDWQNAARSFVNASNDRDLGPWAEFGIQLTRWRYTPEEDWLPRTVALYRATWAYPRGALWPEFPRNDLLPGRYPIRRVLSKVKRALGFKPRGPR